MSIHAKIAALGKLRQKKVGKVMADLGQGKLKSSGVPVRGKKQALAIALRETKQEKK